MKAKQSKEYADYQLLQDHCEEKPRFVVLTVKRHINKQFKKVKPATR